MEASTAMMAMSGMSAVSSGASAFAQYKQGQAQQAAYDYNAEVSLEKMRQESQSSAEKYAGLMGRQASLYAKAGVDISSGSPLLMMAHTAMQGAEEQGRIRYAGQSEADIQRYYGEVAESSATTGAMSTFLTGLGKAGMDFMKAKGSSSKITGPSIGMDYGN